MSARGASNGEEGEEGGGGGFHEGDMASGSLVIFWSSRADVSCALDANGRGSKNDGWKLMRDELAQPPSLSSLLLVGPSRRALLPLLL